MLATLEVWRSGVSRWQNFQLGRVLLQVRSRTSQIVHRQELTVTEVARRPPVATSALNRHTSGIRVRSKHEYEIRSSPSFVEVTSSPGHQHSRAEQSGALAGLR